MTKEQALYEEWVQALQGNPDNLSELHSIKDDKEEIQDRFYKDLTFGTAGLRGIIGMGTNRMNLYTVGRASQGLAQYLLETFSSPSVAIAYDSRHFSKEFAEHASSIFAANGIKVHLFPKLAPTPTLSYAVRELHADCGIVVTASHNPAQYNGYKVYGPDGCQIDNDVADIILNHIEATPIFTGVKTVPFQEGVDKGTISYISEDLSQNYCNRVMKEALQPEVCQQAKLRVTYTPLNGTGGPYVQEILKQLGITDVHIVPEQAEPNGDFPTCPYPNPEFPEALQLGLKLAAETESDFLMATDPDADRLAIAVRHNGNYLRFSGNQLGVLFLNYIASTRQAQGTLPSHPVTVRSIVTTKLTDKVAAKYGVELRDVLTGFKFIGEVVRNLEAEGKEDSFIFGYEEACGFVKGTYVRDKDAIVAALMASEMVSYYKLQGKTLFDVLQEIYKEHGYYNNMAQNLEFKGAEGMAEMTAIMNGLRENPPTTIVGRNVVSQLDYQTSIRTNADGTTSKLHTRSSNVLEYHLEDGCGIIIRPSGTEPKLKLYYSLIGTTEAEVKALQQDYVHASEELAGVKA